MKELIFCFLLLMPMLSPHDGPEQAVVAQEGNPDHREPPPGESCNPVAHEPLVHECHCHRTCSIDEGGNPVEVEDPKCHWYCFKHACTCGSDCP